MCFLRQLCLIIAFLPLCVVAQDEDSAEFTSDLFRGITSTDVLPKGRLQWETYASYEHSSLYGETSDIWNLNTSVFRYGIGHTTELSVQGAWLYDKTDGEHMRGFSDVAIGFKTRVFDGWKAVPSIALGGRLYIPGGKDAAFMPEQFGYQADLICHNQLTSWFDLTYMGSLLWDGEPKPTTFWGVNFGFPLSDKLYFSLESDNYYYGIDDIEDRLQCWLSLTLTYQVHSRVELGVCSDINLQYPKRFFNLALGVAWQLTKK